jgi:two-component system alkaline phosphatase synthesis response regulator PhoP
MVAVEGGGVRIFKKQFRGYHRGQVDNLLTNMEKEKEQGLLDLKQEMAGCLRHNYELVQEIEKIVWDLESNRTRDQGDRLEEIVTELRSLRNRARSHNQKMEKIAYSLDLVLESYISDDEPLSTDLVEKGTGELICAATDDKDTEEKIKTLDGQVIPSPGDTIASTPTAEKSHAVPRVLVTDDDDTIRAVVKLMLERGGYEVIEATNGREVLQMMEQTPVPDIIILDLMMPYIDGLQVIKKIRSHPEWERVPVIMLSANISENEVVKLLKAGANDYVTKPFNPRELVARVNVNIERFYGISPVQNKSSSGKET